MGASPVEDAAGGTATSVLGSGFRFSLFGFRAFQTSDLGPQPSDRSPRISTAFAALRRRASGSGLWASHLIYNLRCEFGSRKARAGSRGRRSEVLGHRRSALLFDPIALKRITAAAAL